MQDMVRSYIESHNMIGPSRRFFVCVSGGMDSMVLLHVLCALAPTLDLKLVVLHFDHELRGQASLDDAAFVRAHCKEHALPYVQGKADVGKLRNTWGVGLEEGARRARYAFFESQLQEGDRLALGHHGDDQAETMLLHLVRGSGAAGLSGMLPVRGDKVRPLLFVSRHEIEAYATKNAIAYREDASNADTQFTRNALRHQVIPLLRAINPQLTDAFCKAADTLSQEDAFLQVLAQEAFIKRFSCKPYGACINLDALPIALARRVTALSLAYCNLSYEKKHIDAALNGFCNLPNGFKAKKYADMLYLLSPTSKKAQGKKAIILGAGVSLGAWGIQLQKMNAPQDFKNLPSDVEYFTPHSLEGAVLRYRKNGDRMGSKPLKKILIDLKIPQHERDYIPLLAKEEQILWIHTVKRAPVGFCLPGKEAVRAQFFPLRSHP